MTDSQSYRFPLARNRRRLICAGITFFIGLPVVLVLGGALAGDTSLLATGGIVGALMLPFALYLAWALWRPVLVLSAQGVFLRGIIGSGEISVTWDQIEALRLDAGGEGLVLKDPMENRFSTRLRNWAGLRVNGAPITAANNLPYIAQCRFIPLDAFAAWFEDGSLRDAFAAHAPQLMVNFDVERSQALAPNRKDRKVVAWVLGLTGIYVLGVIGFALADFELSPAWSSAANGFWKLLFLVVALGMAAVVWSNLRSVRHYLAERQWGMAVFWLLAGLVQAGIGLAALAEALR